MLRSLPGWLAVLASAATFTLVHHPISAVPVFFLGVVTGVVYMRTRWLVAPILAHAVYNGAVFALALITS